MLTACSIVCLPRAFATRQGRGIHQPDHALCHSPPNQAALGPTANPKHAPAAAPAPHHQHPGSRSAPAPPHTPHHHAHDPDYAQACSHHPQRTGMGMAPSPATAAAMPHHAHAAPPPPAPHAHAQQPKQAPRPVRLPSNDGVTDKDGHAHPPPLAPPHSHTKPAHSTRGTAGGAGVPPANTAAPQYTGTYPCADPNCRECHQVRCWRGFRLPFLYVLAIE
jgi:hypothetical protein